jgi:hypothetical protein
LGPGQRPSSKTPRLLPRPITDEALSIALDSADDAMRALLALGAFAGLRAAEIAGLDWSEVYLAGRELGIACRMGGHRWCEHDSPSPEGTDADDPDTGDRMSTPDVQAGPLRPAAPLVRPLAAPGKLPPHPDREPVDPQARHPHETRMAWARRQVDAGLLEPGEIDRIGAEMFGVDPRTVRRWRTQAGDDRSTERTP